MYKIGILSDCHLDAKPYGLEEKRQDIFKTFKKAIKILLKEKVNLVVIAGDLFDNEKPSFEAYKVASYLSVFDKLFWIEGNHDRGVSQFLESLGFKNTDFFAIDNNTIITGVNYYDNHNKIRTQIQELYTQFNPNNLILVLHANFSNIMPYLKSADKVLYASDLEKTKLTIIGHFHNSTIYKNKILIPGSLERLDITNKPERKLFIIEVDKKGNVEIKDIIIPTRKVVEVRTKRDLLKVLKEEIIKPIVFYSGNPSDLDIKDILFAEKRCLLFDIRYKFKQVVDDLLNQNIEINPEKIKDFIYAFFKEYNIENDLIDVFMENFGDIKKAQKDLSNLILKETNIKVEF